MIYFDHAATSFPKPKEVTTAVCNCLESCGGNAGRGAYQSSLLAAELLYDCRAKAAALFGAPSPERVVFTVGATAALNQAIQGSVKKGDHVLISDLEHNAVFRPVWALAKEGKISYDIFPTFVADPNATDADILCGIERRIRPNTKLLVCTHASNICSAVLPVAKIGMLCQKHNIRFVLDAAQSSGHLPVHLKDLVADVVCIPGHKGLLGPQGVGLLIFGEQVKMNPVLQGGSGVGSLDPEMPKDPPERYEAGTLPLPAIAGLRQGITLLQQRDLAEERLRENCLWQTLANELKTIQDIDILAPHFHGSVFSFWTAQLHSEALTAALDERGFCVRAGFHCAALAHKTLGTPSGGAVRVSFGPQSDQEQVHLFATAVREILAGV